MQMTEIKEAHLAIIIYMDRHQNHDSVMRDPSDLYVEISNLIISID